MVSALPVAEKVWRRAKPGKELVGWIYGVHSVGAAFGVLATAFFLIPEFGLKASLGFLCGLSFLVAIGIFALRRRFPPVGEALALALENAETPLSKQTFDTAFGLGFLGIHQLLCVRVLSQTLENTVYTYASILSVYLAGASLGDLVWQRFANRNPKAIEAAKESELFRHGLLSAALLILFSLHAMAWVPVWRETLWPGIIRGRAGLLIGEVLVSGLVLSLSVAAMGGLLPHLLQTSRPAPKRDRRGIERKPSWRFAGSGGLCRAASRFVPQRFLILISLAYAGLIPSRGLKARWLEIAALGVGLATTPDPAINAWLFNGGETPNNSSGRRFGAGFRDDGRRRPQGSSSEPPLSNGRHTCLCRRTEAGAFAASAPFSTGKSFASRR